MKRLMLSLAAFAAMMSTANAQCYVTMGAGMTNTTVNVGVGPVGLDGLGASGAKISARGGCDLQFDKLVIGGFAEYAWSNAKISVSPGIFTANLDDSWGVGVRSGWKQDKTLFYGLAKYTEQNTSWSLSGVSAPRFRGVGLGAGIEYDLTKNVVAGLEGTWTRYASESVGPVSLTPTSLDVTARIGLKF